VIPAASGQTGSIQGKSASWAWLATCSGCAITSRSWNRSSRPEMISRAPGGNCGSRAAWNSTISAKPVPSPITTRQGWPGRAGSSCRITSTRSVATRPGRASARDGLSRRSRNSPGRWNSTSRTVFPPTSFAISAPSRGPSPGRVVSGARKGVNKSRVTG
jgi:hypothetical protein